MDSGGVQVLAGFVFGTFFILVSEYNLTLLFFVYSVAITFFWKAVFYYSALLICDTHIDIEIFTISVTVAATLTYLFLCIRLLHGRPQRIQSGRFGFVGYGPRRAGKSKYPLELPELFSALALLSLATSTSGLASELRMQCNLGQDIYFYITSFGLWEFSSAVLFRTYYLNKLSNHLFEANKI